MSLPYGINAIVYSHPKQGKSWLGDTTPGPRLVLDAEGGSRFTPSKKIEWDPVKEKPPVPDDTWDTAFVTVHSYQTIMKAYEWLNSGQHPFRSVVIDSVSEVQQRAIDDLVGINQMTQQDWGTLLRKVTDFVRKFRDLSTHKTKPLDAVLFIAMAKQSKDDIWRPYVQGGLADTLPYYVDVCGWLQTLTGDDGQPYRRLIVSPMQGYVTGERVGGRLGQFIDGPDMTDMLNRIRKEPDLVTTNEVA